MHADEAARRVPVAQAELEFVLFVIRVVRFTNSMPMTHASGERLTFFAAEDDEREMCRTQREEAACLFDKPYVCRASGRRCRRPGVCIRWEEVGERWLWLQ